MSDPIDPSPRTLENPAETRPNAGQREPQPATPVRRGGIGVAAALAIGALIGGASGAGVTMWAVSGNQAPPAAVPGRSTTITVNDPQDATQITAVAAQAAPSVVTISVSANGTGGTGSGVVLSADGYVLTNAHVVLLDGAAGEPTVQVETHDGRLLDATLVGADPIADLAVIRVEDVTDLQPATFADSSDLNVGDTAIAIGAPLGLSGTVTSGVVSALNRSITVASSAAPEPQAPTDEAPDQDSPFDFWQDQPQGQQSAPSGTVSLAVIQTDASINPGNSGGALLNSDGEVIGINVAIASAGGGTSAGSIGVGFAIPSNYAQRIAGELRESGTASHGLLGATVQDVTEDPAQSESRVVGASINGLTEGGAAATAGLRVGDIITSFNGIPITGKTDLTAQVRTLAGGATAEVTYVRGGDAPRSIQVELGELQ